MTRFRPNPPPHRAGLNPSCVVVPKGWWDHALHFMVQRFPAVTPEDWRERLAAGEVVDDAGRVLQAHSRIKVGQRIYYFRTVPDEQPLPFQEHILYQDDDLVVADKPHFLPVIPSGKYVRETLLVRLGRTLDTADLAPIHRIDRDTAGIVLFSRNPATRNLYAKMFREHALQKTYHAVARWNPDLPWPVTRHTRMEEGDHFMRQAEVPGVPNALSTIRPLQHHGGWALYELQPVTGQRHQLRVHMDALGLPILNDGIYPTLTPEGSQDFQKPLQLLAQSIAFTDPVSGQPRRFESRFALLDLHGLPPTP